MDNFKPVLNGKGLLAASIALLSGPALAEVAGRVSFVSGDAIASGADGNSRVLKRGDIINGGDRITTRAGRLQLRFTDGGFVSLQPNTVFGVDEYLYTNRKPEETSLFFSLVQGGMRTITGAIGKVNKKSYQVRTPVATIGIRGTEYLASVGEKGLIVSVGSGFVNVANKQGEITGGAGQNIRVPNPEQPPALGTEKAEILARTADDTEEDSQEREDEQQERDDTVAVGDVQNARGDYLFLFTTNPSLPDSAPPKGPYYTIASPALISGYEGSTFFADFDQDGSVTGTAGALVDLYGFSDGSGTSFFSYFHTDTLKVVNSGTVSALSWGEFTNGGTGTNSILDFCINGCSTGPSALTDSEFLPYIVGIPATSNLGKGTATYTLQGATPARDQYGNAGRVDGFKVSVNLDFSTVEAALRVTMPGQPLLGITAALTSSPVSYTVNTNGPVSLLNVGTAGGFSLDSSMLTVADSTGACASSAGSCTASINGFFAGATAAQIGATYQIDDWMNSTFINGVAALGLANYDSSTALPAGPGYTLAFSLPYFASTTGGYTGYDQTNLPPLLVDTSLTASFDGDDLLTTATASDGAGGTLIVMDRMTAVADGRGKAGALTWGRWYSAAGTDSTTVMAGGGSQLLNPNDSLHYIMGPMTQPNIFSGITSSFGNAATATYTYQGGTTATGTDGSTGKLTSGSNLVVTFGPTPTLAMDLRLDMNAGNDYHLTSIGTVASISSSGAKFLASSGSGSSCAIAGGGSGGCTATVSGFFAGQQAQQIGLGYSVNDLGSSRQVNGAAAFGRGRITPGTAVLQ
ncbi:MAG: hypothetical protein K0Q68_2242 [Moraxellaceae bacterium]|nr:hypothetical protein [Moraxellaceae bacterium]